MDVVRPRARPNQNQDKSDSEILYLRYNECYEIERRKFNKDMVIKYINVISDALDVTILKFLVRGGSPPHRNLTF